MGPSVARFFSAVPLAISMASRCPECYAELPEDALWVCPGCGYTLRTPRVSKIGILFLVLGLVTVIVYVVGPTLVIPRNGWIPFDLVDYLYLNWSLLVILTFGLGLFLVAAGAWKVRAERAKVLV